MSTVVKLCAGISLMFQFIDCCQARSEHEVLVGAQAEQICNASTIQIVGKFFKVDAFKIAPNGDYPNDAAVIAAAACKASPVNKQLTIVAVAYESDKEYIKKLVIALVDNLRGKVISGYQGEIGEDATMKVESGSLWIDTAAYNLAKGVRAFGLDITSGYIANCGDGGFGAMRTLYVQDRNEIRPILDELMMSHWTFVKGGNIRCMSDEYAKNNPETVIENVSVSIKLGNGSTNGYRDLLITEVTDLDNDEISGKKPVQYLWKFDGKKYFNATGTK